MQNTILIFTADPKEHFFKIGGTDAWSLNKSSVASAKYAVLVHKQTDDKDSNLDHGSGFMIGKINRFSETNQLTKKGKRRLRVHFSEFAYINVPELWSGNRNPIEYKTLDELNIDVSSLDFKSMPDPEIPDDVLVPLETLLQEQGIQLDKKEKIQPRTKPLTLEQAKIGLSLTFGVTPDDIKIVINA